MNIESSKVYNMEDIGTLIRLDQMNKIEVNNVSMSNSILNNTLVYVE